MGRRRERRLAAISAAGRRVKLDLFADPSGEVAGKTLHDETGEGLGQENCADVPNSPSSSGPKQENPLLLLGQYSDDEVDHNASKENKPSQHWGSSVDTVSKVGLHADSKEETEPTVSDCDMDNSKLESALSVIEKKSVMIVEENNVSTPGACLETYSSTEKSLTEDCGMQIIGDFSSDWKIVMHEESNRCYYWNIQTGETSWEVPDIPSDGKVPTEMFHVRNSSIGSIDASADGLNSVSATASECVVMEKETAEILNNAIALDLDGDRCNINKVALLSDAAQTVDESSEPLGVESDDNVAFGNQLHKDVNDCHASELIKKCENLLEKLKAIEGLGTQSSMHMWTYRYTIEVETRLCDCKELLSFGSSINPFWRNTELQLERIGAIIEEEVSASRSSFEPDEVGLGGLAASSSDHLSLEKCTDSVLIVANSADKSQEESSHLAVDQYPIEINIHKPDSPDDTLESKKKEFTPAIVVDQSSSLHAASKVDTDVHEEVDMDVEMEVDDEVPASILPDNRANAELVCLPVQQNVQECFPFISDHPPIPYEEFKMPPPPEEEWAPPLPPDDDPTPPPPPDNDLIPPPPMEEPSLVTLSSYPETEHALHYAEHYGLGYSAPSYQYYASVTEAQSSGYYSQVDGTQVAQAQPVQYFESATSTSYANAPVAVSMEPVAFYDVHSGSAPPSYVGTSFGASVIYVESGLNNSSISTSDPVGSVELVKISDENLDVPSQKAEIEPVSSTVMGKSSINAAVSSFASVTGNALANGNVADASTVSVKNMSKVARTKKRVVANSVPTLRSNKKVSSLVDKWKAAKEELHGDEDDEPHDAYEILERKKKKEIEQWHAQQLASGEGRDNANFVPVRGDWRERVKRKRSSESSAEASLVAGEQIMEEKRRPDLVELAKGLPLGWQAYWDESSREVYYGNLRTSETTWTRPTS